MTAGTSNQQWQPVHIEQIVRISDSSMKTAEVVTDAGPAYLKYPGGCNDGPHPLACEWIGSHLANWFGLPIPDFTLIAVDDLAVDMLVEAGASAIPGTGFISRKMELAAPWAGDRKILENVENTVIIPSLVLFDTWTLNWDRCPPENDRRPNYDNLLIVGDKTRNRKSLLIPIDYGECFSVSREISRRCAIINRIQDERIYGLFDAFRPYMLPDLIVQAAEKLAEVDETEIRRLAEQIPKEWEVETDARNALIELICRRAAYLADNGPELLKYSNNELF